jgi:DNA polymerase-3 subunit epsilon
MLKAQIVDIETAGFLHNGGAIVELGIVGLDLETGECTVLLDSALLETSIKDEHFTEGTYNWIFKNSTLTPEMVKEAPPAEEVFKQAQAIFNDPDYRGATAFNKAFDFSFLRDRGLFITGLPCPMLLSTELIKVPFPNGKCCKWPKVEEAYGFFFPDKDYRETHRGADDAMREAEIVYELHRRGLFL